VRDVGGDLALVVDGQEGKPPSPSNSSYAPVACFQMKQPLRRLADDP